tara:strand:- start:2450 stop:2872 length:423 start_codon:yes stop_codon:yes gene_type:complete
MRGWYKAKASYKDIPEDESYKVVAFRKHNALLNGEAVSLETCPRLMGGKDFGEHLEACDEPIVVAPVKPEPDHPIQGLSYPATDQGEVEETPPEKSAEPSDDWTKDEIKAYMDDNFIEYNSGDTKADLLVKCSAPDEGGE